MPTANRRPFVELALEHFARQDYAPAELIVVDSGDEPVQDLCAQDARVRYIRANRGASIGTKRNLACAAATGDVVVHWDDDDWFGPQRLRRQIEPIASGRADVTGLENRYVWNLRDGSFWTVSDDLHKRMFVGNVHGGTLAYRRSLLGPSLRYDDVSLAEDAALLTRMLRTGARLERVANDGAFVYVRHGRNAWTFEAGAYLGSGWSRTEPPATLSTETIQRYRALDMSGSAATAWIAQGPESTIVDCLGSTEIVLPPALLRFERCIALAATEQYAEFLDGALHSLARFGGVANVPRVVFVAARAPRCELIASRHGAQLVRCRSLRGPAPSIKGVIYSITRCIEAEQYLCLDADVLVLDSLVPLFEKHAALPKGKVVIGAEATPDCAINLRQGLQSIYLATPAEATRLLRGRPEARGECCAVNDGLFVADREALSRIDQLLRDSPEVGDWVRSRRDVWWRQKAALNLALACGDTIVPLDNAYNVQLHVQSVKRSFSQGRVLAHSQSENAKMLHFNGRGKNLYSTWRNIVLGAG
jgi:hypothetical protein